MSLPGRLLIHTVAKVRPAQQAADAYGDQALDYGGGATRTTVQVRMQQDARGESHDALRDPVDETWTMFANDLDVQVTDRFEWAAHPGGSVTFEVWGPPEPVYDSASAAHHLELTLRVRRG